MLAGLDRWLWYWSATSNININEIKTFLNDVTGLIMNEEILIWFICEVKHVDCYTFISSFIQGKLELLWRLWFPFNIFIALRIMLNIMRDDLQTNQYKDNKIIDSIGNHIFISSTLKENLLSLSQKLIQKYNVSLDKYSERVDKANCTPFLIHRIYVLYKLLSIIQLITSSLTIYISISSVWLSLSILSQLRKIVFSSIAYSSNILAVTKPIYNLSKFPYNRVVW